MACRQPECEVPAGRVADRDDPGWVDTVETGKRIGSGRDVLERAGPAASLLAHPPVLDVPDGEAPARKVVRQWRHQRAVPPPLPETSVNEDDRRARPLTDRQVEIPDLVGMVAVRDLTGRREPHSELRPLC